MLYLLSLNVEILLENIVAVFYTHYHVNLYVHYFIHALLILCGPWPPLDNSHEIVWIVFKYFIFSCVYHKRVKKSSV